MAKILVVDDETDLEVLIKQKFRKQIRSNQYEFLFAYNGKEALEKLVQEPDTDLVLSDINMPEMDGLTATTELRRSRELDHIPIIALTANLMHDVLEQALEAGCNGYIEKPIKVDELPEQVMAYLPRS